ncbi:ferrochelatase [Isoalcanivorax indicus]|uniref:ferrochelatase n=1 Tax=Isoalcanivorax indicus TaxID=2202653 RepID=UPI000DB9C6C1|nr:ferrochelatase [Isoalcanivorax indicus]
MYKGADNFRHSQADRIGVLITNLGTPDAPTAPALRRYLREFLSDPRVVEVPRLLWWLILNLIILRIRPRRSAAAYRTVWTDRGSPLLYHTRDQCEALRDTLRARYGERLVVDFAMRYGQPAIADTLQRLQDQGVRQLIVLPLYPQYSAATTASTFDALAADMRRRRWLPDFHFISHYHDFPPYLDALAGRITAHWKAQGRPDKLILSYHGIPKRYLLNGDPYHCECHKTSRLLAERLGLGPDDYMTTFQSRFGREEWLRPYMDETMKALPGQGVKHVHVVCPGFSADCLETIEEIGEENREYFMEAGGERYDYIPALNAGADHIEALSALLAPQLEQWLAKPERDAALSEALAEQIRR